MHSTEVQAKPLFSWKALGWALLYFWFFSTLLQAIIYISGYSGTNGIRDSLLFSSLWLIPVFLFPKRIKIIAAVIGVVLWAASLAALCYYVIYGQEFSQSVLFVMFETNTNEASEYLSQYFSLKIVLIALAYTAVAVLLWTRLRPVYIPKPWRYVVSFALLYGLILHPIAMNTFIKNKPFEKTLDNLASRMEPAAPWQFLTGYYQYRQQLNSLTKLLNENNALPPHKTQGRNEDNPTRHMYTIPFLLWTSEKWQATHPRDFSQDVDRKYSLAELIHTWSDLAGLSYDGYDPTRSVVNPQFKETTRWIGNPYKKNALIDYDTLPYGDQVGNQ